MLVLLLMNNYYDTFTQSSGKESGPLSSARWTRGAVFRDNATRRPCANTEVTKRPCFWAESVIYSVCGQHEKLTDQSKAGPGDQGCESLPPSTPHSSLTKSQSLAVRPRHPCFSGVDAEAMESPICGQAGVAVVW